MKTKKISWQAIAIVVLALVLIASIALGVSGAWFQDKDSATTEAELGKAVTIRLVDTATSPAKPITWSDVYKSENNFAYPGDKLLGATSILPGSDTPSVFRVKITPTVEGTGYVAAQKDAVTITEESTEEELQKYNSYLINTMLDQTKLTGWSKGATEWYYFDTVYMSANKVDLFGALKLSENLTNEAATWKVSIKVEVEAIQAANLIDVDGTVVNEAWVTDMGTAPIKADVTTYNTVTRKK